MSSSYFAPADRSDLDDAVSAWSVDAEDAADIYGDINTWDVSAITDFSRLFQGQENFNSDIGNWDVSNGTSFRYMFTDASSFNQNIKQWEVSAGTDFSFMFYRSEFFNKDISEWDVSNGIDFDYMFLEAISFDQDISYWAVREDASLRYMFSDLMITNQGFSETPTVSEFGNLRADVTPPSLTSAETSSNGTGVILGFDEELSLDLADTSAFRVEVDGKANAIVGVYFSNNGSGVFLELADYIKKGQTITISYIDPTIGNDARALEDLAGNDVESFSNKAVTNHSTRGDHSEDDDGDSGNDGNSGDDGDSGNDEKETTPSYRGTKRNDKIKGDNKSNKMYGLKGNDWLYGKLGNDVFNGGKGRDTAQFSSRNNTIKLTTTKKQNTGDGKDRLISIENVNGGGGKDKIIGNKAKNILNGQKGKDRLYGGKNDDILIGGGGKDKCWGQQGRDTFRIKRGAGYMIVKDFSDGKDRIQLGSGHKGLKLKTRGDDVYVYQRKDLLAVVEDAAGDLTRKGKYLV